MANTENRGKAKGSRHTGPEPKMGRILCKPAPDAEDRLRRLFTLLAKHVASDRTATPEQDDFSEVLAANDHAEDTD